MIRFCHDCGSPVGCCHPNCPSGPCEEEPMDLSVNSHLDPEQAVAVVASAAKDDPTRGNIHVEQDGYPHFTVFGTLKQLEELGHAIINSVAALNPIDPDDDDDEEEDEDATQTEPALLPATALVDAKGK